MSARLTGPQLQARLDEEGRTIEQGSRAFTPEPADTFEWLIRFYMVVPAIGGIAFSIWGAA